MMRRYLMGIPHISIVDLTKEIKMVKDERLGDAENV